MYCNSWRIPDETMALRVRCTGVGVDIPCDNFFLLGVCGVSNSMVDSRFLEVPASLVDSDPNDCIIIEVGLR